MNPLDKEEKAAKLNLKRLTDKIKLDFSFKRIATLGDYLRAIDRDVTHYRPDELSSKLTFPKLKEHLDDLRIALDTSYWLKRNPPDTTYELEPNNKASAENLNRVDTTTEEKKRDTSEDSDESWRHFPRTSRQAKDCHLFWFQKRDTQRLLNGIDKGLRAQLLIAQAGHGKTYIAGAFIATLLDRQHHIGKTVSPWPYFYITRASVVEQTKRVLETQFGIDTISECMVTNYDQLRATLGTLFLEKKTIIESGIPYQTWIWKPYLPPCVFIIDESQAAKNRDSEQAQIIRNISHIDSPHVHCVFVSATPFTRVSEAEYFVLNCRIDDKIL